jgi:Transglutaminase-like superfamily
VAEPALGRRRAASVLAELAFWRVSLPLLRRVLSLERLVRLTASPSSRARDPRLEALSVRAAARLWRSSQGPCLERSVALHRVLGRAGASPTLVCGMAHNGEELVGHAWVEADGRWLVEPRDPRDAFVILTCYSADGERMGEAHAVAGAPRRSS